VRFLLFPLVFLACAGAQLSPAQQERLDRFECQARALAPVVEPVHDAVQLLRDLREGKADLGKVLKSLAATEGEVRALVARLEACDGAPEPQPAQLVPASW